MSKLVKIYQASGEIQAMVIKGLLESHGIPCYIQTTVAPSVYAFTVDGVGQYAVLVSESDAAPAQEIITERQNLS